MIFLLIPLFAVLYRLRGTIMPKWLWLLSMTCFTYGYTHDVQQTICWLGIYAIIGCLPTHNLMSAMHGNPPERRDHWSVRWMQDLAEAITWEIKLAIKYDMTGYQTWKLYGVVYGLIRGALNIPLFFCLYWLTGKYNLSSLLLLGNGIFYYVAHKLKDKYDIVISELLVGAVLGIILLACK